MRIIVIAISIFIASISTASAQFALDHGHAEDAAAAARAAQQAAWDKAAAINAGRPLKPSQQTDFAVGGRTTIKVLPKTAAELKAEEEGQVAWKARCRPAVVEDSEGLRRVKYAEGDCDLSHFNTAGAE